MSELNGLCENLEEKPSAAKALLIRFSYGTAEAVPSREAEFSHRL